MPTLESKLIIGAKDETGGAFASIQKHIAAIDKQISTFDKLMAATRGVAKANDPMIASIDRGAKALTEEKAALEGLARAMTGGAGSAEEMAVAQGRLAASVSKANRALAMQGAETTRVARAQERTRKGGGLGGMAGGIIALGGAEVAVKAVEAGASLEQMKFRLRGVSGGDKTEAPFAEALAAEIAAKYPAITQAKALDTYLELRGNAANQNGTINQGTARRNLMTVAQAQTAALAIGQEITPEDAQNLLKAVEGSGRAGDPTSVGKMFDSYIRAKQVFGSAIDSSKIRDYVQNAKGANFGIGEEQFFWQNIVRMTEGNASRLGNETAQTLQTLVGGHATKQTARWLVDMGLATGFTPQGGGAATIHGLSGSGTLQVNQLDWANQYLLPALKAHGVLSEENIKAREALLKKDNPNIDDRTLRERAEVGLISSAVARSGMRTTVTDNLAHAIANELLINRDVAQMKGASSSGELAARIGQNPVASMAELTGSISNLGATLMSPALAAAGPLLDKLSKAIETFGNSVGDFNKKHPMAAVAEGPAAAVAGGLASLWGAGKLFGLVKGWLGLGAGRAAGGVAAEAVVGGEVGSMGGPLGMAVGAAAATAGALIVEYLARKGDSGALEKIKNSVFGAPGAPMQLPGATPATPFGTMPYLPTHGRDPRSPQTGPWSYYPPKSVEEISVSGQAHVEHEVTVKIEPSPLLTAIVEQARNAIDFVVPLAGGGSGRMDGDAGPHRTGGIGKM
jgi:hypothetical protein